MFFERSMQKHLRAMAEQYPVVTITGPRQSGKTTLAQATFPDKPYVNLEALQIKARWNQGLKHRLYFYRDAKQNEVDVLFKSGHQLLPIEIKSAKMFHTFFCKGIKHFQSVAGERVIQPHIIYAGQEEQKTGDIQLKHYTHAYQMLDD